MTQYNTLNVKLSNSQLNKLKSGIKNSTEVTLKLWSNVGDSHDENNFLHKFLLTNVQVLRLRKAFAINSSAKLKFLKIQLYKIGQSGGVLGRLLGPWLKPWLPLMRNELKPLAKRVLIPLGLTAAASATYAAIHKRMLGSSSPCNLASCMTTSIILNEEINDIMKSFLKNLVYW